MIGPPRDDLPGGLGAADDGGDDEETFTVVVVTAVTEGDSLLGWSPWGQPVIVVGDPDISSEARSACESYGMMLAFVPERLVVALDEEVRDLFPVPSAPAP